MLDAAKIKRELPRLEDYGKNVLEWVDDLKEYLLLYDITEPKKVFIWVLAAVEDDVKDAVKALAIRRNGEERYPKFSDIQKAVESYLEITEGDTWAILRNLMIAEGESLEQFNHRYKKLYHNLNRDYQKLITIKEYKDSISSRVFPCSQVSIAKVDTLQEAYEIAELAETTEKEIQERNEELQLKKKKSSRNTTMVTQNRSYMTSHPIYQNFMDNEDNYQYKDELKYIKTPFGYNRDSSRRYQPRNYYSKPNPISDRRFMGNLRTDKKQIYFKTIPKRVTLDTNDQEAKDELSKKSSTFRCFRCNQLGHKSPECPYTFKDLAEMEEKGLLN